MGFVDAIKSFYKRYVDFEGRSSRSEYWWVILYTIIVYIVIGVLFVALGGMTESEEITPAGIGVLVLLGIFILVNFLPSIAVAVRRFHDQDKSGWFYLLSLIPYVGGIIMIVFMCIGGTPGSNRFGMDPLGRAGAVFD